METSQAPPGGGGAPRPKIGSEEMRALYWGFCKPEERMSGGCRRCAFCGPESLPDGAARRERGECEGGGLRSRPGTQVLNQAPAHTACGSTPQTTPTCTPRAQASPATRVGESAVQRTRTVQYSTGQYRTCTGQYVLDRQCAPRTYTQTRTYGGRPFSTARECPSTQEFISQNELET